MPLSLIIVAVFVVLVPLIALPGWLRRRRVGSDYGGGDRSLRDTVNAEREKARGWSWIMKTPTVPCSEAM